MKIKVCGVQFRRSDGAHTSRRYHYFYDADKMTLDVGDICVVDTGGEQSGHNPQFVNVIDPQAGVDFMKKASKMILAKVDFAASAEVLRTIQEISEVQDELERRIEQRSAQKRYEAILKDDPDAQKLIDRLRELGGL